MDFQRLDGGLKKVNNFLKSVTPKVHWLMRLITGGNLIVQLSLFNSLIGKRVWAVGVKGQDLIFTENCYR